MTAIHWVYLRGKEALMRRHADASARRNAARVAYGGAGGAGDVEEGEGVTPNITQALASPSSNNNNKQVASAASVAMGHLLCSKKLTRPSDRLQLPLLHPLRGSRVRVRGRGELERERERPRKVYGRGRTLVQGRGCWYLGGLPCRRHHHRLGHLQARSPIWGWVRDAATALFARAARRLGRVPVPNPEEGLCV